LQLLEDLINITLWGAQTKVKTQGMSTDKKGDTKTATEVMDDIKPQADRLTVLSKMAEKRHKFILDNVIRLQVAKAYSGSSVNYGRRYMIEGPDVLKDKYADAKIKKLSASLLDSLYEQYLEAEYAQDEVRLTLEKKKLKIKPFFHDDTVEMSVIVTDEDKAANKYFEDWIKSQTNEGMLLSSSEELLREQLYTWVKEKVSAIDAKKENDLKLQQQYSPKQAKPAA
jgi:hypothetical protein